MLVLSKDNAGVCKWHNIKDLNLYLYLYFSSSCMLVLSKDNAAGLQRAQCNNARAGTKTNASKCCAIIIIIMVIHHINPRVAQVVVSWLAANEDQKNL